MPFENNLTLTAGLISEELVAAANQCFLVRKTTKKRGRRNRNSEPDDGELEDWNALWRKLNLVRLYCQYRVWILVPGNLVGPKVLSLSAFPIGSGILPSAWYPVTQNLVSIAGFSCPILSENWLNFPELHFYSSNRTACDVGSKNLPA